MAEIRHLEHAPITEAVIDFRVEALTDVTVDTLVAALEHRGYLGYARKGPIVRSEFGFSTKVAEAPQAVHTSTRIGVRIHSPDDRYVALFGIEGFTLSRLEPYESWENLVGEARRLWEGYRECLGPLRITRIATRYINNLRLPTLQLERFMRLLAVNSRRTSQRALWILAAVCHSGCFLWSDRNTDPST